MTKRYTIGVVGNPGCGKTTLFNALTGTRQRAGNWPGVAVGRKIGRYFHEDARVDVVDLPGIDSLDITDEDMLPEEKIVRDYVQAGEAELIVNIVDASRLERSLHLSVQLVEMRKPLVVALNRMDTAETLGMEIDMARLAAGLGCPVVPLVAKTGTGVALLKAALAEAVAYPPVPAAGIPYDASLERAIAGLLPDMEAPARAAGTDRRWLAAHLLEGDDLARRIAGGVVTDARLRELRDTLADHGDILLASGRYGFVSALVQETVKQRTLYPVIPRSASTA